MELKTKDSRSKIHSVQLFSLFIDVYLIVVFVFGIVYLLKDKTGNIGTVFAYIMNKDNLAAQAFIYTAVFEILFTVFAVIGSIVLLILFNLNHKRVNIISIFILLLTSLFYITSRVYLITGTVHMVTNGAIKNTDFSDVGFIYSQYIKSGKFVYITLALLAGVIIIPAVITRLNNRYWVGNRNSNIT